MKLIKQVSLVFLVFISTQVIAQDRAIRVYTNFARTTDNSVNHMSTISNFGKFSPSFSINTEKGNFHELELSSIGIGRYKYASYELDSNSVTQFVSGGNYNFQNIGLKYEFSYRLFKNSTSNLQPFMGIATNLNFSRNASNPFSATSYATTYVDLLTSIFITPRLIYQVNDNWFFDLNVPFNIAQIGVQRNKYLNPILPVKQHVQYSPIFELIPNKFTFKLGLGYRFN